MEAEHDGLYKKLADPEFYKGDGSRVAEAKSKIEKLEKDIADAYVGGVQKEPKKAAIYFMRQ